MENLAQDELVADIRTAARAVTDTVGREYYLGHARAGTSPDEMYAAMANLRSASPRSSVGPAADCPRPRR